MTNYFKAKDGKFFEDKKECEEYEKNLIAEEEREKKKMAEKEARYNEVKNAYETYLCLLSKYNKDYGHFKSIFEIFDLI